MSMQKAPAQTQPQYELSSKPRVFTINRNGTPWVTVRQIKGGVQIIDPSGGSDYIMNIAGGAKGGVYPTPAPAHTTAPSKSVKGAAIPVIQVTSPP
jgi:hypothetical protein